MKIIRRTAGKGKKLAETRVRRGLAPAYAAFGPIRSKVIAGRRRVVFFS